MSISKVGSIKKFEENNIEELSRLILAQLDETSAVFSEFQKKTKLICPKECGKCCFNHEVVCNPYELLPLAFHLLHENNAVKILENAKKHQDDHCVFLQITNKENGSGYCNVYPFRPFICRVFGVAVRRKKEETEYCICSTLKESYKYLPSNNIEEIPFIEIWKKKLESLDPKLMGQDVPINQAIVFILEKLLLTKSFESEN